MHLIAIKLRPQTVDHCVMRAGFLLLSLDRWKHRRAAFTNGLLLHEIVGLVSLAEFLFPSNYTSFC